MDASEPASQVRSANRAGARRHRGALPEPTGHRAVAPTWLRRAFADDVPETTPGWHLSGVAVAVLVLAVIRIGPVQAFDTIWAEDASIFLRGALDSGISSLFTPYAGYMHAVPRIASLPMAHVPLAWAPAAASLASSLVSTLLAVVVYRATGGYLRHRSVRAALAVYMGLVPMGTEVLDSIANLQWYLLFTAFVLLLWAPRTRWEPSLGAVVAAVAAMSSPFGVALVPLAALAVWVRRTKASLVIPAGLLIGVAIQLTVMSSAPARQLPPAPGLLRLGVWFVARMSAPVVFGHRITDAAGTGGAFGLGLITLLMIITSIMLLPRRSADHRLRALLCLVASAALYFAINGIAGTSADRYAVPTGLVLALALALCVDGHLGAKRLSVNAFRLSGVRVPHVAGWIVTATVAATTIGWLSSLPADTLRSAGPSWHDSARRSAETCQAQHSTLTDVGVSPPGWLATLPCSYLAQAHR